MGQAMSTPTQKARYAQEQLDKIQTYTLYLVKHCDREGLSMLNAIRSMCRDADTVLEGIGSPNKSRAARIADEVLTGLEQSLEGM
jgi:hypothetical protein